METTYIANHILLQSGNLKVCSQGDSYIEEDSLVSKACKTSDNALEHITKHAKNETVMKIITKALSYT